jgi:hypothetical protein
MRFQTAVLFLWGGVCLAQGQMHDMSAMDMSGMDMAKMDGWTLGKWRFSVHGAAFIGDIQETGRRGVDKAASVNWAMGVAERDWGGGTLSVSSMLSLEPATITGERYPELFQTGETAYGKALVDGQHPHNLFMELAATYSRKLGEKTTATVYLAPVGAPALGPVAFPHRESAAELPQATLAHHLEDSTHVSYDVATVGLTRGMFGVEASGFHGAEPGENRWAIGGGTMDSWAARLTVKPGKRWSAQVSAGRLAHPEALEPGDIVRSTASVSYNRPFSGGNWASSLIWGRNHETATGRNLNGFTAESVVNFRKDNYVTGRVEAVDKDELLPAPGTIYRIGAYTLGYTRNVPLVPKLRTGLGANFTVYSMPAALRTTYGERPAAFWVFLRVGLK